MTHTAQLQGLEAQIATIGQEEAQLDSLIERAGKARRSISLTTSRPLKVLLGSFLFKPDIAAHFQARGIDLRKLDLDRVIADRDFVTLLRDLQGAIVLLNSNDLSTEAKLELIKKLYANCPDTLFVAWAWDNHHMVAHSAVIGQTVDVQYLAHSDNMQIYNRFCPFVRPPLPAAVMNWTMAQAEIFGARLAAPRPVRLSGSFFHYPQFEHRNAIVQRLKAQSFGGDLKMSEEGSGTGSYLAKTPEDKWAEWAASKANLIVPTLSDLPIRLFDALLTGNIPLLPRTIAHVFTPDERRALAAMPVVWFDYADLADMGPLVDRACDLFDAEGIDGILRRHRYALQTHMIESRIATLLDDLRALGARGEL